MEERGYTILGVDYKQKMGCTKKSFALTFCRLYEYYEIASAQKRLQTPNYIGDRLDEYGYISGRDYVVLGKAMGIARRRGISRYAER